MTLQDVFQALFVSVLVSVMVCMCTADLSCSDGVEVGAAHELSQLAYNLGFDGVFFFITRWRLGGWNASQTKKEKSLKRSLTCSRMTSRSVFFSILVVIQCVACSVSVESADVPDRTLGCNHLPVCSDPRPAVFLCIISALKRLV